MRLLAPKLLLDVFAQLRQRREAITTAAVVVDVERINVYEAFALKVDEGEIEVAGIQCTATSTLTSLPSPRPQPPPAILPNHLAEGG